MEARVGCAENLPVNPFRYCSNSLPCIVVAAGQSSPLGKIALVDIRMRLDGKRPWLHAEKHRDTTYGRLRRGSELLVRYVEHLLEKPSVPVEYLMTMQPMFEQRVKARVTPFL